jgi:hypothetical protein
MLGANQVTTTTALVAIVCHASSTSQSGSQRKNLEVRRKSETLRQETIGITSQGLSGRSEKTRLGEMQTGMLLASCYISICDFLKTTSDAEIRTRTFYVNDRQCLKH